MTGQRWVSAIGTTAILAAGLGLSATPVRADTDWNDYSISVAPFVAGPTPFTVSVDGPDPVCTMTYGGHVVSAAPWAFTYDPQLEMWDQLVLVDLCDNRGQDSVNIPTQVAYRVETTVLAVDQPGRPVISVANATGLPAEVTVATAKGKTLVHRTIGESADIRVPVSSVSETTRYAVTVTNGADLSLTAPVTIAKGWAPMFSYRPAVFPNCSTLTWSYSTKGQPKADSTMQADVAAGLKRLSQVTGLRFRQTNDAASADIRFGWENLGTHGPSGIGGVESSSAGMSKGHVQFNTHDAWPSNRNAGFGLLRGYLPGRGWLVIHETMHALGFDHVNDKSQVMNPVGYMHQFGKGDLQGLTAVYPKAACAAK